MIYNEIKILLLKDICLEIKQRSAFNAILLYAFSTTFIVSLIFKDMINPMVCNSLFWIILCFSAINAVGKSFSNENTGRHLYYYSLVSPVSIISAKILYNNLLVFIISIFTFIAFLILVNNWIQDLMVFFLIIFIGNLSLSTILTFVAGISSQTKNNTALMAVLSFPLLLPSLIILIKLTNLSIAGAEFSEMWGLMAVLLFICFIVILLSVVLFPYLWKE